MYPQLGAVRWDETWTGWVAMTTDHVPRVHELAPGLWAGLGYNGRGIAAATLMGRELAARARGAGDDTLTFPLVPVRPQPMVPRGAVPGWRVGEVVSRAGCGGRAAVSAAVIEARGRGSVDNRGLGRDVGNGSDPVLEKFNVSVSYLDEPLNKVRIERLVLQLPTSGLRVPRAPAMPQIDRGVRHRISCRSVAAV